ncbi:MAG: hypothetical protein JWO53_852, partial [Chlamydiia bacterium]|nr:hypothetical protein [Chlamydiia bacterium]
VALDALIKKTAPTKVSPMLQKEIEKELLHFQQINHDFVDHLRNRLSLIQWNHAPRKGE